MPKKKRQPVNIDESTAKQLRALSEELGGIPVARLVRNACDQYIAAMKKKIRERVTP